MPSRPIRADDGERERRLFDRLSDRSRYQRFMQHLAQLTPQMLELARHLGFELMRREGADLTVARRLK